MKEYGGYLEWETYDGPEYHDGWAEVIVYSENTGAV